MPIRQYWDVLRQLICKVLWEENVRVLNLSSVVRFYLPKTAATLNLLKT